MAPYDKTSVLFPAAQQPDSADADRFTGWLFKTVPDGEFAAGLGWQNPVQPLFSLASDDGMFEDRGGQNMARDLGLDVLAANPSFMKPVDILDTASPAYVMFDALQPGMPWTDAIGAAKTTPLVGTADLPIAAQTAPNTAAASSSTALAAPQVLASGTWLGSPQITLKTSLGNIVVDLYPNAAPVTVANLLAHVSSGFYDDLLFHRIIPGFVVQGGGFTTGQVYQTPPYAPITLESNNGLQNDRGTLAMARTDAPNSATSQFFINLVDNDFLNYSASSPGYAVFGRVLTGLSVVDAIAAMGTPSGVPIAEVKILEADLTRQGTLHSTSGRIDLGILAADAVWTGKPEVLWQYSLDAGAHWTQGAGRSFTAPQGAYEFGTIQVRYMDLQLNAGSANSTGGNMVVDSRAIVAGDGGANTLTGTSAVDIMYGLGGNDTLDGGSGADSMIGGTGNDIYVVQIAGDKTVEASGGGTDRVNASVSFTLATELEQLTLTGSTAINGTGNTLANTITGNSGANLLTGNSGNDTLSGGAGNDTLTGGTGNDSYTVDHSADVISEMTTTVTEIDSVTSAVAWTLGSNLERLTLTGSTPINGTGNTLANTITGNSGANLLTGNSGNDTLSGGAGNDTLTGGTGNDSYTVDHSADVISETTTTVTEIDSVTSAVAWTLGSNLERLTLTGSTPINGTGNTLANTITGNSGANLLTGNSGNDTLSGGAGNDTLTGGTGNDSYTVDHSADVISETTTTVTEIDSVTSAVAWTLGSNLERLTLTGSTPINGTGNTLANTITGNSGANLLNGNSGNDTLTGGTGLDIYRFSSALNGSSNVDVVSGFLAADDAIQLENSIFLKLTTTGALNSALFHASTTGTAADSNDHVNYETDTGKLYYDADGNGAGVAVLFATLTGAPTLTSADIFVT